MSANRFIEQEKIRKSFFLPLGITESKCVYFINGIFGIGKSRFLKRFLNEAVEKKVVDSVFFIDNEVKPRNFYEIFKSANDNFISSDETFEKFTHAESDYNLTRFNEILELLEKKDEGLCEDIRYNSSLISETDYILNDNQANIRIIDEQLLDNYIDKKGDKRLVLDMYRVSIEAFIVDLMNYYFPWENVGDDFERFYFDNEPKKILIAFDNIDKIDYSLLKWFTDYLVDYSNNKSFSDFISYNISYIKENTKISKYLDIRYIISSREDYLNKLSYSYNWNKYESLINSVELQPFDDNDLQDLSDELKVKINEPDVIIKLSKGLPALIVSYIEYFDLTGSEQIKLQLLDLVVKIILKGIEENQKDWIICSSFLNEFDEKGLRCFNLIGNDYNKAFIFLSNKNSIAESVNGGNKVKIKPVIREFITEYLKETQPEFYNECISIANTYENVKEIVDKFANVELNVIRSFAYFKSFDSEMALEETFKSDLHLAKEVLHNQSECFLKNKCTFTLKPEISEKLDEYNKVVDGQKYEMKKQLVKDSWQKLSEELLKKQNEFSNELEKIKSESSEIDSVAKVLRQEYEKEQSEFLEIENTLIEMRRETLFFTKKSNISAGLICLTLTVILGLITNFFPDFFKDLNSGNKELYNILYISSYTFSILFGILTIVYLIKEINLFTRKDEYKQLQEDINSLEEENNQRQKKMRANKDIRTDSEIKLSEMQLRTKLLESELESIKMKLDEPFI